jgi:hypothetical protein
MVSDWEMSLVANRVLSIVVRPLWSVFDIVSHWPLTVTGASLGLLLSVYAQLAVALSSSIAPSGRSALLATVGRAVA